MDTEDLLAVDSLPPDSDPPKSSKHSLSSRHKELALTLPQIATIAGVILSVATFAATFIFANRGDVTQINEKIRSVELAATQRSAQNAVTIETIRGDLGAVRVGVDAIKAQQQISDRNLERLLRRQGVRPYKPQEIISPEDDLAPTP